MFRSLSFSFGSYCLFAVVFFLFSSKVTVALKRECILRSKPNSCTEIPNSSGEKRLKAKCNGVLSHNAFLGQGLSVHPDSHVLSEPLQQMGTGEKGMGL